jgi:hypothetical protein
MNIYIGIAAQPFIMVWNLYMQQQTDITDERN